MLEILFFIAFGIAIGVFFGLVPGLHPNLIILLIPFFIALNLESTNLIVLIVSIAVSNSIIDFIPSILLGAPDSGSELSVLPGHKMLMQGYGYQAIKLTVIGGIGSVVFCTLLLPFIIFLVPPLFNFLRPYTYIFLIVIVLVMILTEKSYKKRIIALLCFLVSGFIGIMINNLPIDNTLILFPIFSGLFGLSMLLLQIKNKATIPKQKKKEFFVSKKLINRSVIFGSFGGILSGLLPGVGSSEMTSLASTDKNDKSFLITNGAITTANIILSIMSLWLISRPRSGVAVVLDQIINIGFNEFILIVATALFVCGITAILTLFLSKKFINWIEKIDYSLISKIVLFIIVILTFIFTGTYGIFLLFICCSFGLFVNLMNIKRGILMGVLILPTILFYFPI
ncbi:MAG: tripartite tricarboxylate transporter permease [Candidatus Aenigmatarchaeota archaeon]